MDAMLAEFERNGLLRLPGFCPAAEAEPLSAAVDEFVSAHAGNSSAGARDILRECPAVAAWAGSRSVRDLTARLLGGEAFVVRGILFDKRPDANWSVAWHQDLTIAVRARRETPGFGPWSVKMGVPHVQPPVKVLERMAALRLHLDDCPAENGALRSLPGTHLLGRLDAARIADLRDAVNPEVCAAQGGDLLVMKPLILHSSESSRNPTRRRVLHIEFASDALPGGLEWAVPF